MAEWDVWSMSHHTHACTSKKSLPVRMFWSWHIIVLDIYVCTCTLQRCTYMHTTEVHVRTCTLQRFTYVHAHYRGVRTCTLQRCTYMHTTEVYVHAHYRGVRTYMHTTEVYVHTCTLQRCTGDTQYHNVGFNSPTALPPIGRIT